MKTKKLLITLSLLAVAVLLAACGSKSAQSSASSSSAVSKITAEEAKKMMDAGGVTVVDVRTADEYAEKHIEGAILIPNEDIGDTMPALLPDKDTSILLYCRSGNRSAQAAKKLADIGYAHIYDFGGIKDWPYDTVSGAWDADAADKSAADTMTSGAAKTDAAAAGSSSSSGTASAAPSKTTDAAPSKTAETAPSNTASASAQKSGAAAAPAKKSGTLASFSATTLDGKSADESLFSGYKLTMINVWATYCGPCLGEMPELGELSSGYADKGVQIVGIVFDAYPSNSDGTYSDSDLDAARRIVDETGASYTHLLPSSDLSSAILDSVYAVPTTVFVDASGNQVGKAYIGSRSKSDWAGVIDSLLKEVG